MGEKCRKDFFKLARALVLFQHNSLTAGNHCGKGPTSLRSIETKNGLTPFGGFADFVSNSKAGHSNLGDKDFRLSQPLEVSIMNLLIVGGLTDGRKSGIPDVFRQYVTVLFQSLNNIEVDGRVAATSSDSACKGYFLLTVAGGP